MSKNTSQTLTDLRWVAKDQLATYGITGRFSIDRIAEYVGVDPTDKVTYTIVLRLRNPKDRFIYELHGGDKVIWQQILSQFAELRKRRWSYNGR